MNTITIELCKEDRQRLDEITTFLGLLVSELKSATPPTVDPKAFLLNPGVPEKPEEPEAYPIVEDPTPFDEPAPAAEPEKPKVTREEIQALVQKLAAPSKDPNAPSKRTQVRDIVKQYAERVGEIPEDKFDEVMAKLIELDKEA